MEMEFELMEWGDGTIRLHYEDRLAGRDRSFVLTESGEAFEATRGEDYDETMTPVSLVLVLRAMALEGGDAPS